MKFEGSGESRTEARDLNRDHDASLDSFDFNSRVLPSSLTKGNAACRIGGELTVKSEPLPTGRL